MRGAADRGPSVCRPRVNSELSSPGIPLRPNIKWHDGQPFTAKDLLFTLAVRKDPDTAIRTVGRLDLVQSASAPDPLTFVMHWSAPYAEANQALDLEPMPIQ